MWCFPLHEKYITTKNWNGYSSEDYVHIFKAVFEVCVEEGLYLWL